MRLCARRNSGVFAGKSESVGARTREYAHARMHEYTHVRVNASVQTKKKRGRNSDRGLTGGWLDGDKNHIDSTTRRKPL